MKKHVKSYSTLLLCGALLSLLVATGCSDGTDIPFRQNLVYANTETRDFSSSKNKMGPQRLQEISNVMVALFGTPDHPIVLTETGLVKTLIEKAAGKAWNRDKTQEVGLYRKHCVHCHGVTGDGKGPTAIFMDPYPRDYRQGKFKFKSTAKGGKPTDDDLKRVLTEGLDGTYMPSFKSLLDNQETEALVEYVKYLAIRGQTEQRLLDEAILLEDEEPFPTDKETLLEIVSEIASLWKNAADSTITPKEEMKIITDEKERQASIARGRAMFNGKADCKKCHGISALGDGLVEYDDWNESIKTFTDSEITKYGALPKQELRPRNLRLGYYRGGSRPLDIYRKIRTGIGGTKMPNVESSMTDEQVWDIVRYVLNLPYEPASQPRKPVVENKRTP